MKTEKEKDANFGYKLGRLLASVIFLCGASLLMAVTIKIISWMFL